ncbi:hypothetical protein PMAYCL1PPCAC_25019, partial [Pristionchus mayeri]
NSTIWQMVPRKNGLITILFNILFIRIFLLFLIGDLQNILHGSRRSQHNLRLNSVYLFLNRDDRVVRLAQ